ncbi:MAG TPA: hypothetical protein VFY13_02140, partial [Luteolibacter sp.]|nr:hypothetical protein [Luteolibacter sp.]
MDWLFGNFGLLLVIGFAIAGWIKKRAEMKQDEDQERRAREELIRSLERMDKAQTRPHQPASEHPGPPPLHRPGPPPLQPAAAPAANRPVAQKPAHAAAAATSPPNDFQARLEAARRAKAESEELVRAAKAKSKAKQAPAATSPAQERIPLRSALKKRGLTRQAIVMREILGPP